MAAGLIHRVIIYRVDGRDIEMLVSDDIKQVETMYKGLDYEWVTSTAEKRPFRLPEPKMHSFAPSLISEIVVESISQEEYHKQSNPYWNQMKKEGLSGSMNRNFNNGGF